LELIVAELWKAGIPEVLERVAHEKGEEIKPTMWIVHCDSGTVAQEGRKTVMWLALMGMQRRSLTPVETRKWKG
jgi:hypothetical protein